CNTIVFTLLQKYIFSIKMHQDENLSNFISLFEKLYFVHITISDLSLLKALFFENLANFISLYRVYHYLKLSLYRNFLQCNPYGNQTRGRKNITISSLSLYR